MGQETLIKTLIAAGLGSRRKLADAIRQGKVMINGEIAENFLHPVNQECDIILFNKKIVNYETKTRIVLMLNKPIDVLSTTKDDKGRKTVMELLPPKYRDILLYPIGRLDKDTTGLLLITNDGDLTYQLTHPKFEHEKEYLIFVGTKLSSDEKMQIENGIELDDGVTYPSIIKELRTLPPYNYSLIIHEGRKRQIHRMFARLGVKIFALKRIRVGRLKLGNLKDGEIRQLTPSEIAKLL
jgi:23S rRNA pseudouridine2605 synthase